MICSRHTIRNNTSLSWRKAIYKRYNTCCGNTYEYVKKEKDGALTTDGRWNRFVLDWHISTNTAFVHTKYLVNIARLRVESCVQRWTSIGWRYDDDDDIKGHVSVRNSCYAMRPAARNYTSWMLVYSPRYYVLIRGIELIGKHISFMGLVLNVNWVLCYY